MGAPFSSGHVLALRRFPASSIGPGYTAVWHRDPAGLWTFYSTSRPELSCSRYFGQDVHRSVMTPIDLHWQTPDRLRIAVQEAGLVWEIRPQATLLTRAMNAICALLPAPTWKNAFMLKLISTVAGSAFGLGKVNLTGYASNGQHFMANPLRIWLLKDNKAWLNGMDLGPAGPLREQAHLGDFYLPQKAVFSLGQIFFTPAAQCVIFPISATDLTQHESLSEAAL